MVTILIPAHNEAGFIGATVQNKLEQNYPKDKLQIVVVSDGSNDSTDDIVRQFADRGVQLLRCELREGKAAALNEAFTHALGEIIVFSDANSLFDADAIRRMVENFSDPQVGYVTGALNYFAEGSTVSSSGVDAYMRYENLLRQSRQRPEAREWRMDLDTGVTTTYNYVRPYFRAHHVCLGTHLYQG